MQNGDACPNELRDKPPSEIYQPAVYKPIPPRIRKPDRKYSSDLTQARALQQLCYEVGMSLKDDLISARSPKSRRDVSVAVRSAVQAWEICADRARIARNRPLPGSLRPEPIAKRKPKASAPTTFSESPQESSPRNES